MPCESKLSAMKSVTIVSKVIKTFASLCNVKTLKVTYSSKKFYFYYGITIADR